MQRLVRAGSRSVHTSRFARIAAAASRRSIGSHHHPRRRNSMRFLHGLQTGAIALACLGLLFPTAVLEAAETLRPQIDTPSNDLAMHDIALAPGGVFNGQV